MTSLSNLQISCEEKVEYESNYLEMLERFYLAEMKMMLGQRS
ncbi:hypothetical protein BVRB_5g112400 isoform A [Beta vulgaris subsp. vulgaris]|nr:hypothetical protein BVRB_5g112400 isoform A [Beta vulgaris subsp. vulgaris]